MPAAPAATLPRHVHPILFQFGPLTVHTFGVLVGLGFVAGLWVAGRRARAAGLNPDVVQDLVFPWILVGGLVGARLWYVASYWQRDFAGHPLSEALQIWRGGLVFYGGLAGAFLAATYRLHRLRLPYWKVADVLAPGIALGHVFGRLGCLLNGCCHGRPADLPWAIRYPRGAIPFDTPVHPAQLYEAGLNLLLCGALVWLHARRRFDGQVFGWYLVAYACIRSIAEYFRGDYDRVSEPARLILTPGQATSAVILVAGLGILGWCRSRHPAAPDSPLATKPR